MPLHSETWFPTRRVNITSRLTGTAYTFTLANLPKPYTYLLAYLAVSYLTDAVAGNRALFIQLANPLLAAFPPLSVTYPVGGINTAFTVYQLPIPAGLFLSGGIIGGYSPLAVAVAVNFTLTVTDLAAIDPNDVWFASLILEYR